MAVVVTGEDVEVLWIFVVDSKVVDCGGVVMVLVIEELVL